MAEYTPHYTITPEIIRCLEAIAKMQGELVSRLQPLSDVMALYALANVDAVHFSTKLEGNPLTYEQVTHALSAGQKRSKQGKDLKEILNYAQARAYLFEQAQKGKPFAKELILETHKILLKGILVGKLAGHYRDAQNVIRDSQSHAIVYMPPQADNVSDLMQPLLRWVQKALLEKTSPLLVAPIFHYYFVTIHPFMDGNGRMGRLLSNMILFRQGYTVAKFAAIEKQHEQNRAAYYAGLRQLQGPTFYDTPGDIDLSAWIEYYLKCLQQTYAEALERCNPQSLSSSKVAQLHHRLQNAFGIFQKHKRLTADQYGLLLGLGRTQSVSDLNQLVGAKLVERVGAGRSRVYRLKELVQRPSPK